MNQYSVTSSNVVKEKAGELGFHKVGIAAVYRVDAIEAQRLQAWIELGYHADMEWISKPKSFSRKSDR